MGKKHPLELFREHPEGFENASRQRRTVTGRVVGTSLHPVPPAISAARGAGRGPVKGGVHAAASDARSSQPTARKTSAARAPLFSLEALRPNNRKALYGVLAIFGAFALYLMGVSSGSPALKRPVEDVFSTGTQLAAEPASPLAADGANEYAILAATYGGSEHGKQIARITRDVLRDDGFPRVEVVGFPDKVAGEYERFELLLGRAARTAELNGLLEQIRGYRGPPNDPAPFRDAYVIEVPEALRTGS